MSWDQIQNEAVDAVLQAEMEGHQAILLTLPTGGGKTRIGMMLIDRVLDSGRQVEWMTHRKLLFDQTDGIMNRQNLQVGHRRSGYEFKPRQDVTLTMLPTERTAVLIHERRGISQAQVVLVDEAHLNCSGKNLEILRMHLNAGHTVIGLTATPADCSPPYTKLVVGSTNSVLRAVGAHVPCHTYGPSEIDTTRMRRIATGFSPTDLERAVKTPVVFGEIIKHHKRLNPDLRPAMLFAPSVDASKWISEEYRKAGVEAAHIDGKHVVVDGKEYQTSDDIRADIIERYRTGDIKVLCNRFVLREGIDIPETYHGIGATVFGSEHAFIQAGGRILRAHPTKDHCIWQCHGGSWWRYGSLNQDRDWALEQTKKDREKRNKKQEKKACICPRCEKAMPFRGASQCPSCGFEFSKRVRKVIEEVSGDLQQMDMDAPPPKKNYQQLWDRLFWASKHSKSDRPMSFKQLAGMYCRQHDGVSIGPAKINGQMVTAIYANGKPERLLNAPEPGSEVWTMKVRDSTRGHLQS